MRQSQRQTIGPVLGANAVAKHPRLTGRERFQWPDSDDHWSSMCLIGSGRHDREAFDLRCHIATPFITTNVGGIFRITLTDTAW